MKQYVLWLNEWKNRVSKNKSLPNFPRFRGTPVVERFAFTLRSNNPEHVWNTFRFGITALKASHQVKVFLMSEGAELDTIPDSDNFDISNKIVEYKNLKGEIYACGTCLKIRKKEESKACSVSTMADLLKMIEESDKVLVFG